jgi:hypothetical protein
MVVRVSEIDPSPTAVVDVEVDFLPAPAQP